MKSDERPGGCGVCGGKRPFRDEATAREWLNQAALKRMEPPFDVQAAD
jgi:hypothetical protein